MGGEREKSDQWVAASGVTGAECFHIGDHGKVESEPFGGFRSGGEGAEKHGNAEVDSAHGGGDGVQFGIWDSTEERKDSGGIGGEATAGERAGNDRGQLAGQG